MLVLLCASASVLESVSVGAGRGGRLRDSIPIMRVRSQPKRREDAWVNIFVRSGRKTSEEAGDLESPEWPTDLYPASYGRAKKRINRLEYRPRI